MVLAYLLELGNQMPLVGDEERGLSEPKEVEIIGGELLADNVLAVGRAQDAVLEAAYTVVPVKLP